MPKVSVIIPVYNAKDYLERCLNSVCNQTLKDIEIICIDDCSTDNSLDILNEYSKKYLQMKVIHHEVNGGESKARNTGVNAAKGEYLGFVDNDDMIDLDFFEKLYIKAKEDNADIAKCDVKIFDYNGKNVKPYWHEINQNLKQYKDKMFFAMYWWSAIYKTELLKTNNIKLPENIILGGDIIFLNKAVTLSNKVVIAENTFYNYFRRENSGDSKILNEEKVKSVLSAYSTVLDSLNNNENISALAYNYVYYMFYTGIIGILYKAKDAQCRAFCANSALKKYSSCKSKDSLNEQLLKICPKELIKILNTQQIEDVIIFFENYNSENKMTIAKLRENIKR